MTESKVDVRVTLSKSKRSNVVPRSEAGSTVESIQSSSVPESDTGMAGSKRILEPQLSSSKTMRRVLSGSIVNSS